MRIRNIIAAAAVALSACLSANGQNRYEEVIHYESVDGKIIIPVNVRGTSYRFMLDLRDAASTAILSDYAEEMEAELNGATPDYPRKGVRVVDAGSVEKVGVGENIFRQRTGVYVVDDDYLRELGVAGIAGCELFSENVITIDAADLTLTVSAPYKPSYVRLRNRTDMVSPNVVAINVDGQRTTVSIDLLRDWVLSLDGDGAGSADIVFANCEMPGIEVDRGGMSGNSIGTGILAYGVISFDYPKMKVYFEPRETLEKPVVVQQGHGPVREGNIVHLDRASFLERVFNFRENDEWKYEGTKPAVIDFWAPWCGPCKKLDPILEELSEQYGDNVNFYKVNIDDEKEIANYFKVAQIPLLIFIPVDGAPIHYLGLRPKQALEEAIQEKLLK